MSMRNFLNFLSQLIDEIKSYFVPNEISYHLKLSKMQEPLLTIQLFGNR